MLRWIYTDKIVLDNDTLALDLLSASHHFKLASLFETCERALITSVNEITSLEFHNIAKKVGANKLVEKCLEFSSIFSDNATAKLEMEMEIDNEVDSNLDGRVSVTRCEHVINAVSIIRTYLNLHFLYNSTHMEYEKRSFKIIKKTIPIFFFLISIAEMILTKLMLW